ncbi:uncharacterized protein L969DRAFT_55241 [Mixia osmundae IAM 14324]|uniref:FAD/NAD(P)-binding domain-containing protein n=1 Tax=Mixia osmundae (strain CBS 9802 / IAM 14324 / JCM 22182 / KY 12970) TaxID=764103 RepID=G7DUL3_MIXOS|nr:uncharacterized protein L969DRAFT_55241 [Mixia osmundae IAM 14324]KEI36393.1 hypothetical protein L969DRAFT_55241 [Mixia osmundae IAM 14324]GAA94273.1 hypothetical protein E5Q_00922 [Mixia osmundae IAM 14324]
MLMVFAAPQAEACSAVSMSRVCVIGCGASGIAAIRQFKAAGFSVTAYEARSSPGGAWILDRDPGPCKISFDAAGRAVARGSSISLPATPMYPGLRSNLPKDLMSFRTQRFEAATNFAGPDEVTSYLCKVLGKDSDVVKFNTIVTRLRHARGKGSWKVTTRRLDSEEVEATTEYDWVCVANGHYTVPYIPPIENLWTFPKIAHARWYRRAQDFANERCLVVGAGPSAQDVLREIAVSSPDVRVVQSCHGGQTEARDGVEQDWVSRISVVPPIERTEGNGIHFIDGTHRDDITLILFATGYSYHFPFCHTEDAPFSAAPLTSERPHPHVPPPPSFVDTAARAVGGPSVLHLAEGDIFYEPDPSLAFLCLAKMIVPFPLADAQARYVARTWRAAANVNDISLKPGRVQEPTKAHVLGYPAEFDLSDSLMLSVGEGRHDDDDRDHDEEGRFFETPQWRRELREKAKLLRLAELGYK